MIPIIFYEKPGCVNNTKQKKKLVDFGFNVISTNLLKTNFSKEQLLSFFGEKSVKDCINPNAPVVKNKELNVNNISDENLLTLMIADPILIKRPLIAIGSNKFCGFDLNKILDFKLKEIR
jgi:nitrogenase-associated protein